MALRDRTRVPTLLERLAPPIYATGKQLEPVPTSFSSASFLYWRLGLSTPPPSGRNIIKASVHWHSASRFHTVHLV